MCFRCINVDTLCVFVRVACCVSSFSCFVLFCLCALLFYGFVYMLCACFMLCACLMLLLFDLCAALMLFCRVGLSDCVVCSPTPKVGVLVFT